MEVLGILFWSVVLVASIAFACMSDKLATDFFNWLSKKNRKRLRVNRMAQAARRFANEMEDKWNA